MNAKTAKSLRLMAREQTVGAPEREYYRDRNGTIRLDRDCVRGRYRVLKRAAV